MLPKQTEYKVGMYLRLSKDDERAGESLSIENQRRVLKNYIGEQGWTLYDEYVDDGISGTTFERPGVQRLLEDAKAGKINLILCKDLSRFGRNYIQVGQYTDYIFPMYNIRFIALTDNVDTANTESAGMDMMPIMNVFNEWHSANTSKKIRAVIETNAKAGKYMTTFSSYGYDKGSDEKCTPVIDPEAAAVVRRIFEMRVSGMGYKSIAAVLNDEHILIPTDYKYKKLGKEIGRKSEHLWTTHTVRCILQNPIYIGTLVQLRNTTVSYKNHKHIDRNEENWAVVENNHEPIISIELWNKCREIDASNSRGKKTQIGEMYPLSGFCYCDKCGSKMKLTGNDNDKNRMTAYSCGRYSRFGTKYCTSHFITRRAIEGIVLADIKRQIDFVLNDAQAREKYLARKRKSSAEQEHSDKKRLKDTEKRIKELNRLIQSIYEDKVAGKMPEDMAFEMLEKYQAEKKALQTEYEEMQKRTAEAQQDEDDVDEYIRRLKSYAGAEELTRQMCLELIEYVIVDENPKDKKAARDIHIYYKLIDKPLKNKRNALA
ncbi:recombinase family protein [Ruminococcus albus]|uniref:Site-specific DNA recombinase n=1 Tax=Ruminococcus albus TaxID=1264 RepID=A0A1I1JSZ4_RUMAL|nr:recombinase family protein [Ruminococcus albus]SFC51694.1 Site-specific DNA recombinase [Ruminococcus albus]